MSIYLSMGACHCCGRFVDKEASASGVPDTHWLLMVARPTVATYNIEASRGDFPGLREGDKCRTWRVMAWWYGYRWLAPSMRFCAHALLTGRFRSYAVLRGSSCFSSIRGLPTGRSKAGRATLPSSPMYAYGVSAYPCRHPWREASSCTRRRCGAASPVSLGGVSRRLPGHRFPCSAMT